MHGAALNATLSFPISLLPTMIAPPLIYPLLVHRRPPPGTLTDIPDAVFLSSRDKYLPDILCYSLPSHPRFPAASFHSSAAPLTSSSPAMRFRLSISLPQRNAVANRGRNNFSRLSDANFHVPRSINPRCYARQAAGPAQPDQLPLENASCATCAINDIRTEATTPGNCVPARTEIEGGLL